MSYKPNFSDAPEFSIIPDGEKLFEEITVLFSYYDPFFEGHLADFEDAEREFKAALKGQSDVSADEYLDIVKQTKYHSPDTLPCKELCGRHAETS